MRLIRGVNESLNTHRKVINTKIGDNANGKKAGRRREPGGGETRKKQPVKLRSANKTCPRDVCMQSRDKKLIQRAVLHVKPPEDCWVWLSGFCCCCSRLSDYDFGREKLSSVCARQPERSGRYKQWAKSAVVLIFKATFFQIQLLETSEVDFLPRF